MASMLVLGLGKSGVASARHALSAGEELTIYAGTANDATKAAAREFEEAGVPVIFDVEDIEGSFDTCVVSLVFRKAAASMRAPSAQARRSSASRNMPGVSRPGPGLP